MTKDIEEQIRMTEPISSYEETVENILRDKAYRWSLDYYKETEKTSVDLALDRAMIPLRRMAVALASAKTAKETATKVHKEAKETLTISNMKLSAQKKAEQEYEAAEKVLDDAERLEAFLEYELQVLEESEELHILKLKQFVERFRARSFRNLRNRLQKDGDVDYMRRAVTWTFQYTEGLLKS